MNNDVGLEAMRGRSADPWLEIIPLKGLEKYNGKDSST